MVSVNEQSVTQRLADSPSVQEVILSAAAGARGLPDSDPRAMSHSWLFSGPPGSGRSLRALEFAAALMCTSPQTGDYGGEMGCGRCEACSSVLGPRHNHTDLVYLEPQELSISVDKVREIITQAAKRPTVADWRVIIFDNADRLTDGAANALLKTVEEPSDSTVIIMCAPSADPVDFSQTLRSRCRHLYIPTPSAQMIVRTLVGEGASEHDAQLAAVTTQHHVGRARRLVTHPEAQQRRAMSINLAEDVFRGSHAFQSTAALLSKVTKESKESHVEDDEKEIADLEVTYGAGGKGKGAAKVQREVKTAVKALEAQQKKRATRRLRDLIDLVLLDLGGIYRDALMLKVGAEVEMIHPDFSGLAGEIAERVDEKGLVDCQEAITLCRERLGQNIAPQVALDGLVGRLRLACGLR